MRKHMNFKYLCDQYQLGRFRSAAELNPGTSSQVWRLDTDRGSFLVRTLTGKEQGEREWSIYRHLRERGFTAIPTVFVPCFEQAGQWYQVQEYLTGTMPDPSLPGMAATMAVLAKQLSAALSPMIHGDLGPWNMVTMADGRLMVIDFGESAPGDPCFDFASLLGGVINHTPPEMRQQVCGDYIRALNCDRTHLLEQLRLWAEQGTAYWTGKNETMAARFYHALSWAKEHIYEL